MFCRKFFLKNKYRNYNLALMAQSSSLTIIQCFIPGKGIMELNVPVNLGCRKLANLFDNFFHCKVVLVLSFCILLFYIIYRWSEFFKTVCVKYKTRKSSQWRKSLSILVVESCRQHGHKDEKYKHSAQYIAIIQNRMKINTTFNQIIIT